MVKFLTTEQFLEYPGVTIDVRSPGEFATGHIPEAINLPLFSDEERAIIGATFSYYGQTAAIDKGLQFMSPKLADYVANARDLLNGQIAKNYCWRGGMRSTFASNVLNTMMVPSISLVQGYKAFRSWCLQELQQPKPLIVIGGLTGSGKTKILSQLISHGEQVLDLEKFANHSGSVFGGLARSPQPKNENFENSLAIQWHSFSPSKPIWIEDESRMIGTCKIPDQIFTLMERSPVIVIEKPREERLQHIEEIYGSIDPSLLSEATLCLKKRLGGKDADTASSLFLAGEFLPACSIVLDYYDKTYKYSTSNRISPVTTLSRANLSPSQWTELLLSTKTEAIAGNETITAQKG